MKNYTDLDVWKLARGLVKDVYQLTANFPTSEIYILVSQLRRCVISIPSNIAEGHGRNHSKDTIQFLYIARGSLYELETQLLISCDLSYCSVEDLTILLEKVINCRQLLNGLIRYFENKR